MRCFDAQQVLIGAQANIAATMTSHSHGPNARLLILHTPYDRALAKALIDRLPDERVLKVLIAPHVPKRTLAQNGLMHSAIEDVANQVEWAGEYLVVDTWKLLFAAAMFGQKMVPSLDGQGFVVDTRPTSSLNKVECSDLIDSVYAFGAERGVVWTLDR